MALEDYRQKRKFDRTPEPKGKLSEDQRQRFVVQRHKARHLHYDLRLEMDGVLRSWAIPKGPSMNPNDRRLAISTEDHPVEYLTFEGVIPKGNYGAGLMTIWDQGTYELLHGKKESERKEQKGKESLKILFFGEKLKGEFHLVETNLEKNAWLLIKKKDRFSTVSDYDSEDFAELPSDPDLAESTAVSEKQIGFVRPMLATPAKKAFDDSDWIFEPKWDGYRLLADIREGEVALYSRNGASLDQKFPAVKKELEKIPADCLLDGEAVVIDKAGVPIFQELQNYQSGKSKGRLVYYVFDLLALNGMQTISLPLIQRKSLLRELLEDLDGVFYCDHVEGGGLAFYQKMIESGMEGVVAKRANSLYVPGIRSRNWLKIKAIQTTDAIICGYTESDGGGGLFGSLILGKIENGKLRYAGNCGTGFSQSEQRKLFEKIRKLGTKKNPFGQKVDLKGRTAHWIKPELVCEVAFSEWTESGVMRHPSYKGLRADKVPAEADYQESAEKKTDRRSRTRASSVLDVAGISVPVSNLEKVFWPEEGYTKFDLIDYYIKIAPVILPYLINRPQNLNRHPDGIYKSSFYQKDSRSLPEWIETFTEYSESSEKEIRYMLCQNKAALIYMANLGCIEIHPWNSTIAKIENPTYSVIDIDPSPGNSFEEVLEVALAVKEVLDRAQIEGFCKTSGSTGIHVYLPLANVYTHDQARDFAKLICVHVKKGLPKLTTQQRRVADRGNRIYLDYLQNRFGQTLAAPYCVRPKKGASVSAPLLWEELKPGLRILDFTIRTMPERLEKVGDLFKGVLGKGIDMGKALDQLSG